MTNNDGPTLGVHLLETITRGMYSEPLHCIREYVQNAYDSIRDARRKNILNEDEGIVHLIVDQNARTLRIRDNGLGLSPEEAIVYLQDLGNSNKASSKEKLSQHAGFRGIGRMAGISYCKTLKFETSNGNGKKCTVEFDAAGINNLTRAGRGPTTIVDAIRNHSQINESHEEYKSRFLEVSLERVDKGSPILDTNRLTEYLQQTAPVKYDPSVWSFGEEINNFADNAGSASDSSVGTILLYICNSEGDIQKDIRRPFTNTFQYRNRQNKNPQTVRVSDVKELTCSDNLNNGWWGWVAVHERKGALNGIVYRGLRVRMHNIQIGDETIIKKLFKSEYLANWCFGEIHITDYSITPNAQRDNLEPSKNWRMISEQLREVATNIEREIRNESSDRNKSISVLRNRCTKVIDDANKAIQRGLESRDEQTQIARRLNDEAAKLKEQLLKKNRSETEKNEIDTMIGQLSRTSSSILSVQRTGTDAAFSHLDRRTRKVVLKILSVLKRELPDDKFREVEREINLALKAGKNQ